MAKLQVTKQTEGQPWLSQKWNLKPVHWEPPGQHESGNLPYGPLPALKEGDLVRSNPLFYLV